MNTFKFLLYYRIMSEKRIKITAASLLGVTNIESRLTVTYVRNAHDIFTSTTMIVIKAPQSLEA